MSKKKPQSTNRSDKPAKRPPKGQSGKAPIMSRRPPRQPGR